MEGAVWLVELTYFHQYLETIAYPYPFVFVSETKFSKIEPKTLKKSLKT